MMMVTHDLGQAKQWNWTTLVVALQQCPTLLNVSIENRWTALMQAAYVALTCH